MKTAHYLAALALAAALPLCQAHAGGNASAAAKGNAGNSATISINNSEGTATLRGSRSTANILGDVVEIKDGAVYVNGASFGALQKNSEVIYTVTKAGRVLYVDGQARSRDKR